MSFGTALRTTELVGAWRSKWPPSPFILNAGKLGSAEVCKHPLKAVAGVKHPPFPGHASVLGPVLSRCLSASMTPSFPREDGMTCVWVTETKLGLQYFHAFIWYMKISISVTIIQAIGRGPIMGLGPVQSKNILVEFALPFAPWTLSAGY